MRALKEEIARVISTPYPTMLAIYDSHLSRTLRYRLIIWQSQRSRLGSVNTIVSTR